MPATHEGPARPPRAPPAFQSTTPRRPATLSIPPPISGLVNQVLQFRLLGKLPGPASIVLRGRHVIPDHASPEQEEPGQPAQQRLAFLAVSHHSRSVGTRCLPTPCRRTPLVFRVRRSGDATRTSRSTPGHGVHRPSWEGRPSSAGGAAAVSQADPVLLAAVRVSYGLPSLPSC